MQNLALDGTPATAASVQVSTLVGANLVCTATLPADTARVNYLQGLIVTGVGATAGSIKNVTVTGLLGGTMTFPVAVPTGVLLALTPLVINFPRAMQASAKNIAIAVSLPALGAGSTAAAVTAIGFKA